MNDPNHPIWRLLQTALYLTFASFFLWANATSFDSTEIKTLVELGAVMIAGEFVKNKIKKKPES